MKKERKVKCPVCQSYNNKDETIYYQKRYYCKICYENKTKESNNYKNLISYICNIYEIESPTGFMLAQIKNFKDQYNYSYIGMKSTLEYFYNIKTNNIPDLEKGLGIIPYVYEEAKQFYIDRRDIKNNANNVNIQEIIDQVNIINIKKSDKEADKNYKNIAIIDINEI